MHSFFRSIAETSPSREHILHEGSPWGALAEAAAGRRFSRGALFYTPSRSHNPDGECAAMNDCADSVGEAEPWAELLSPAGTFSARSLRAPTPTSFQVSDDWVRILKRSMAEHGPRGSTICTWASARPSATGAPRSRRDLGARDVELRPVGARCTGFESPQVRRGRVALPRVDRPQALDRRLAQPRASLSHTRRPTPGVRGSVGAEPARCAGHGGARGGAWRASGRCGTRRTRSCYRRTSPAR